MTDIQDFEKRGALSILLFLATKETHITVTPLMRRLDISQTALYDRLEELKKMGLIMEAKQPGVKDRHVVTLTEKGLEAAKKLRDFMEVIDDRQLFR